MPVASALPSSWVFNSIPSCFCLPWLSRRWRTTSAFLTGLPLAFFTTITFTDAVFSAGAWDFFPAKDATGSSVPHSKTRVRRWIFIASFILPLMSAIPGDWHFYSARFLRVRGAVAESEKGEECSSICPRRGRKFHYFSYHDRSIHIDGSCRLPLLL